ncbi:MAG: outer membrane protein transport protein [Myxococcota bacterium]
MSARRFTTRLLLLVMLCIGASGATAGGILVQEAANPRNGTAQAGQAAYAYDAATALYNPAGMSRLQKTEVMVGLQPTFTEIEFDRDAATTFTGGDGGDQGGFVPALGSFFVHPLDDRWAVGGAIAGLAGGALSPDAQWAGRFSVTDLELAVIGVNPAVSYRVNDWLSLGAGVSLVYGTMDFKLNLPSVTAGQEAQIEMDQIDDLEWNWNLGVLVEPNDRTRFGIAYRSKVDLELDGDIRIRNSPILGGLGLTKGDVEADIPIPQLVRASVYHRLSDELAILGDIGWEDWSEMDFTPITGPAGNTVKIPRRWHDTWHFGVGLEWQAAPGWLLQTGVAYDTSPVSSRRHNLPDMPSDRQWRYSVGAVYDCGEGVRVGLNYTYVDFGSAPIRATNALGTISGDYDEFGAHVIALSVAF